jgi:hypothetical protein
MRVNCLLTVLRGLIGLLSMLTFRLIGRYQNIKRSSVKREEWPRNEEEKADGGITLKQVEAL